MYFFCNLSRLYFIKSGINGCYRALNLLRNGPNVYCIFARRGIPKEQPDLRKVACRQALSRVQLQPGCYLPSNPEAVIMKIDYDSAAPMQSAAKTPYRATFHVRRCGIDELERIASESVASSGIDPHRSSVSRAGSQPFGGDRSAFMSLSQSGNAGLKDTYKQMAIFKVGDDVRQVRLIAASSAYKLNIPNIWSLVYRTS